MALVKGTDKRVSADYQDIRPKARSAITDFIATMNRAHGFARVARYEVVLHPPKGIDLPDEATRDISLHCNAITMPGHDLNSTDVKFGSAPVRKFVTAHAYTGTITASFYLDVNLEAHSYFTLWQDAAVDSKTHKAKNYKKMNFQILHFFLNKMNILKS